MKAKVDKDKCIGCGTCIAIAPKSFKFGDDGKAEFIDTSASLSASDDAKIKEAIDSCPVSAIESTN